MHEEVPPSPRPVTLASAGGPVTLGDGKVKTIVPLAARTAGELLPAARAANASGCDIVEWRIDLMDEGNLLRPVMAAARALAGAANVPILATFRTPAEGGSLPIDAAAYEELLTALAASGLVQAIDVEYSRGPDLAGRVAAAARSGGVATIASHHDFEATGSAAEIAARLDDMAGCGADVVKIACMPRSREDVLALLAASSRASRELAVPLIAISMGALGVVSRVAAGQFGSCATFASLGRASAPGQVPLAELRPVLDALSTWGDPAT
ncbi:MAG: type I 3-dehydroquinate dehydratase [Actinomycetaceae bacterium]|nr:type I 3-dehydroquinate dehydratase [Actinomycetaceae bacterium]